VALQGSTIGSGVDPLRITPTHEPTPVLNSFTRPSKPKSAETRLPPSKTLRDARVVAERCPRRDIERGDVTGLRRIDPLRLWRERTRRSPVSPCRLTNSSPEVSGPTDSDPRESGDAEARYVPRGVSQALSGLDREFLSAASSLCRANQFGCLAERR